MSVCLSATYAFVNDSSDCDETLSNCDFYASDVFSTWAKGETGRGSVMEVPTTSFIAMKH